MSDGSWVALACGVGALLGAANAAGLWWTTRHLLGRRRPGLFLLGSSLLRLIVTVFPLVLLSRGRIDRLAAGIAAFLVARLLAIRLLALPGRPETEEETGG